MVFHAPELHVARFLSPVASSRTPCSTAKAAASIGGWSARNSWPSTSAAARSETIDPMLFTIYVKPRPGRGPGQLEAVIEEELAKVKTEGITESEYPKSAQHDQQRLLFRPPDDRRQGRPARPGRDPLRQLREAVHRDGRLRGRQHCAQVQDAAKKYFTENNKTVGKLIPRRRCEMKTRREDRLSRRSAPSRPGPVAGAAFKLPAPEKLTLEERHHGLLSMKNADLPLVSFRMWIRGAGTAERTGRPRRRGQPDGRPDDEGHGENGRRRRSPRRWISWAPG